MEPPAVTACRQLVERFRAQVEFLLPSTDAYGYAAAVGPGTAIPLERLPAIGGLLNQLLEAELKLAALQPTPQEET